MPGAIDAAGGCYAATGAALVNARFPCCAMPAVLATISRHSRLSLMENISVRNLLLLFPEGSYDRVQVDPSSTGGHSGRGAM